MKVIRLIYRYSEIDPSVSLLLFFRMIGVYVSERFLNNMVDLTREIDSLKQDFPELSHEDSVRFDANIFLISNIADYQEYNKMKSKNDVIVDCNNVLKGEEYADISRIHYEEGHTKDLISTILSELQRKGILLNYDEYLDCLAAAEVYSKHRLMETTLSTKYFFVSTEEEQYTEKVKAYKGVVAALKRELSNLNASKWGQSNWEHLQFAVLNMAYEVNLYCKRNSKPLAYTTDSMLKIAWELESGFNHLLSSTKILIGQIYDNLLGNYNKAYEYYLSGCDLDKDYDAYVFLLKGQYWQNFAGDYQKAVKYYLKSIMVYPEYYRAWYKLGYSYFKLEKFDKSSVAFETVKKILLQRLNTETIRPMEIEHLFYACNQCAKYAFKEKADTEKAIRYYKIAERAWFAVDNSAFLNMMSGTQTERHKLIRRTKEMLNISEVYRQLIFMLNNSGRSDEATQYEKKLSDI